MHLAINMDKANEQHYEVPEEFYHLVLGPFLKYSSGYWPSPNTTLAESEVAMLELYCERAKIEDGMNIVDLGLFTYTPKSPHCNHSTTITTT